jgi:hypothetical protein
MYCPPQLTIGTAPTVKQIIGSATGELWGFNCSYAESATFYIQIWWGGNTNTVPTLTGSNPNLTVPVTSAGVVGPWNHPVIMQGPIYWAATAAAVPSATAITGGEVITFFLG